MGRNLENATASDGLGKTKKDKPTVFVSARPRAPVGAKNEEFRRTVADEGVRAFLENANVTPFRR